MRCDGRRARQRRAGSAVSEVGPALAVVIVAYNNAAQIPETLAQVSNQLRDGDELVVVDNASVDGTGRVVDAATPRVRVLAQAHNCGFAAGCNIGAAATSAPLLFFLNPDARLAPGCVEALRRTACERPSWGAWQALVTMAGGSRINTAGNVTHFLGMGWAGRCGEPLSQAPRHRIEVDFASGAALVVRRQAWRQVRGFDERYFMYGEDLDLALRLWSTGWGVGLEPDARVEHDYGFVKGGRKWFLLERNRWWTVLSDYPAALLVLLLPALLAAEIALVAIAARGGWLRAKLRSQAAVLRELPAILQRRREVQAKRTASPSGFALHLSASLENPFLGGVARVRLVAGLQRAYWSGVRALVRAPGWDDGASPPSR
jgi:N-acetylglucosaminyl-diphospho-decaprenol L-rhamnosyltransferase